MYLNFSHTRLIDGVLEGIRSTRDAESTRGSFFLSDLFSLLLYDLKKQKTEFKIKWLVNLLFFSALSFLLLLLLLLFPPPCG